MLGDGKTSYDVGNDGDKQSIGGCSVRFFLLLYYSLMLAFNLGKFPSHQRGN
jgi:hypothetical protein